MSAPSPYRISSSPHPDRAPEHVAVEREHDSFLWLLVRVFASATALALAVAVIYLVTALVSGQEIADGIAAPLCMAAFFGFDAGFCLLLDRYL
jgi:hypothetical protein